MCRCSQIALIICVVVVAVACDGLCGIWCAEPSTIEVVEPMREERLRLVFAGDVMAHMPQVARAKRGDGYDFSATMRYVRPIFEQADLAVVNLETTLSDVAPYSGYPAFRTPAQLATALAEAGVDVVMTANNHSLDAGHQGVEATTRILSRSGLLHTGIATDSVEYRRQTPLIVERNGRRIALMNYTYGTNGNVARGGEVVGLIDTVAMDSDLQRAADADLRVAYLHWGEEYSRRANRAQKEVVAFLQRRGVEIVVGSHPHVVQPAERSDRGIVLYSLGNFVSNQRTRYSDGGIVAEVDVVWRNGVRDYWLNIVPVWVKKPDYIVVPKSVGDAMEMAADERAAYREFMADCEALICEM